MANQYLDDLIQNIYTNCDMKGFDDYNRGVQDLSRSMSSFNADTIRSQKQRISLVEAETKSQIRLADYQDKYARKKKQRDDEEIRRMQRRNGLQRYFTRLLIGVFSFQAIKGMIDTARRIELVQKSIQGLTKDTQDWDYIQDQAFKTGTDIEVVAKGYRNFFSSARMAGFDKSGIQTMYADTLLATRSIGASTQQTEGALLALEQMLSKGTVSMEELRRQLGNAIPGAFEIGAKAMNMTTMEFNKFVKDGQLASAVFVPKFIKALKDEYADGFSEISQTVDFAMVNLRNAWKILQKEIMSGQTGRNFARTINSITKMLRSPALVSTLRTISGLLANIVGLVGVLIEHLDRLWVFLAPAVLFGAVSGLVGIAKGFVSVMKAVMGVELAIAGANIGLVTFYRNVLGIISVILMAEEALKGFPTFKRIFTQNRENKENQRIVESQEDKRAFHQKGEDVFFTYNGKKYHMGSYKGDIQKDFGTWKSDSDVIKAYKQMYIDQGKAKEILPLPPSATGGRGGYLEKTEQNTYDVKINLNLPNNPSDPIMTAEATAEALGNILLGLRYSTGVS